MRLRGHLETVRTLRVDGKDETKGIGKADRDLVAVGIARDLVNKTHCGNIAFPMF